MIHDSEVILFKSMLQQSNASTSDNVPHVFGHICKKQQIHKVETTSNFFFKLVEPHTLQLPCQDVLIWLYKTLPSNLRFLLRGLNTNKSSYTMETEHR